MNKRNKSSRYSRQSFLGEKSERQFANAIVAIIGLGGGGSHIAPQLAHLGFKRFRLYDSQPIEDTNLNRLMGGTAEDVRNATLKTAIAERVIRSIQEDADVEVINKNWQDEPSPLMKADVVFGCVDSFSQRQQLEAFTRRYLQPYIDIGIDVHHVGGEPPQLAGQVILSMPNHLCMTCLGFLTPERLAQEAADYGKAGPSPQVVFANGVVASAAVGICVDLLTNWTQQRRRCVYLSYYENHGIVRPHPRLAYLDMSQSCPHFPESQIGDPEFRPL